MTIVVSACNSDIKAVYPDRETLRPGTCGIVWKSLGCWRQRASPYAKRHLLQLALPIKLCICVGVHEAPPVGHSNLDMSFIKENEQIRHGQSQR